MYIPLTILIVSFDPDRLNSCCQLFLKRSYFVVSSRSLDSARTVMRHGRYDMLIVGSSVPASAREEASRDFRFVHPHRPILWITNESLPRNSCCDGMVRFGDPELLLRSAEFLAGHLYRVAGAA